MFCFVVVAASVGGVGMQEFVFRRCFFACLCKSKALGLKVYEINVDLLCCGGVVGGGCRAGGMPFFVVGF